MDTLELDICRICAENSKSNVPLFANGNMNGVGERFSRLIQVNIHAHDGLPVSICNPCNKKLNKWLDFQQSAKEMHNHFVDLLRGPKLEIEPTDISTKDVYIEDFTVEYISEETEPDTKTPLEEYDVEEIENYGSSIADAESIQIKLEVEGAASSEEVAFSEEEITPDSISDCFSRKSKRKTVKRIDPLNSPSQIDRYGLDAQSPTEKLIANEKKDKIIPNKSNYKGKLQKLKSCEICGKQMNYASLKEHYTRHTSVRSSKCSVCSKCFKNESDLAIHMRTHTDERRFVCDICGFAFRGSSALRHHVRRHLADEIFNCTKCTKVFNTKLSLSRHTRIAHEKKFSCPICDKLFGTRPRAVRHLETHSRSGIDVSDARKKLLSIVIPHWSQVVSTEELV